MALNRTRRSPGVARALSLTLWLCLGQPVLGGGTDYQIKYVPDFDQKRGVGPGIPGLPNNGSCHCVPTSAINWVAFLANRGYPQFGPPGNWQNPDRYNPVTEAIDNLGEQMETSPGGPDPKNPGEDLPCGTNGTKAWQVLVDDFNELAPGKFVVSAFYCEDGWCPLYHHLVNAMLNGSLVQMRYGHYTAVNDPKLGLIYVSDGGHRVSLTGVSDYPSPATTLLRYRNPSTSDSITLQSTFSTNESAVQNVFGNFSGSFRTQTLLTSLSTPPQHEFITGYIQIKPVFGLQVPNCCNDLVMQAMNPVPALHGNPPMNAVYTSPNGMPIIDIAIHPGLNRYFFITAGVPGGGPAKLWEVNPLDSAITPVSIDIADPQGMTSDPNGILFVRDGMTLRVIDPDLAPPLGPQIGSVALTIPASGKVEHHDFWKQTAYVSADHTQMAFVTWSGGAGTIHSRPMFTGSNIQGTPTIAADHRTGRYLVKGSENSVIYIVEDNGTVMALVDQIDLPEGRTDAMFIDATGRVGIGVAGLISVYENITGNWQPTEDHPFAGLAAGKHLRIAAGRTNREPSPVIDPDDLEVLPADIEPTAADCQADIAPAPFGNGVVNVDDLLMVINSWGICPGNPEMCAADIAPTNVGNAIVNVDDLLAVINGWGNCP